MNRTAKRLQRTASALRRTIHNLTHNPHVPAHLKRGKSEAIFQLEQRIRRQDKRGRKR